MFRRTADHQSFEDRLAADMERAHGLMAKVREEARERIESLHQTAQHASDAAERLSRKFF